MKQPIFALLAAFILPACTQIDTGNVGVESTLGQVKPGTLPPGMYGTMFKTVLEVNAKEIGLAVNDLKPKSKENLTMADFDVDIYYRIDPAKASQLLTRLSGDMTPGDGSVIVGQNYVYRQARAVVYNVAQAFPAAEMNNRRGEIEEGIRSGLQKELDRELGTNSFTVGNVNVRNVVADTALEESIQNAAKTKFEIDRKAGELELAKKEAERRIVEAHGVAKANEIIAASLTPTLVRLKEIEAQQAFAKAGTHTVIMGGTATPLIHVGK